jgi:hypothetical protein
MPLIIENQRGRDCPVVVCDHCGRQIEDAKEGNYQWQHEGDNAGKIFFTHKACCWAFESKSGEREFWLSMELTCLPIYLGNNLNLDWRKARSTAELLGSLS